MLHIIVRTYTYVDMYVQNVRVSVAYWGGILGLKELSSCCGVAHSSKKLSTTFSSSLHQNTHNTHSQCEIHPLPPSLPIPLPNLMPCVRHMYIHVHSVF